MAKRTPIRTSIHDAAEYWSQRIDETDLSVDWSEAETHCWRCGCERHLQRCHIIPDALGGEDTPGNIVLLCKRCHAEGPNVRDPEIMWDWIKAYRVPFYGTFWNIQGMKEYEFLYQRRIEDEVRYFLSEVPIASQDEMGSSMQTALEEVRREAGVHFGQPYLNTATMAGVYRMMFKKLAADYGIPFPQEDLT